jgi:hypothetical protein
MTIHSGHVSLTCSYIPAKPGNFPTSNNTATQPLLIVLPLIINNASPDPLPPHLITHNQTATVQTGKSVNITLLADDNIKGAVASFGKGVPKNGILNAIKTSRDVFNYTARHQGTDTFSFSATDNYGHTSNVSTETITVTSPLDHCQ